jgi:hypothetical protein
MLQNLVQMCHRIVFVIKYCNELMELVADYWLSYIYNNCGLNVYDNESPIFARVTNR